MNRLFSSKMFLTSLLTARGMVVLCGTILLSACLITATDSMATAADSDSIQQLPVISIKEDTFVYEIEGRPDPFVPFITEKAAVVNVPYIDMNEIIEKKQVLTGMQLFEPGQLTLVALLKSDVEDLAMVQDFTGKGYVITAGTKIGRRGVVRDIASNTVIIEETAETRAGKKIITEVVMTLKKEGEE